MIVTPECSKREEFIQSDPKKRSNTQTNSIPLAILLLTTISVMKKGTSCFCTRIEDRIQQLVKGKNMSK
jgi:hypothetical protein